MHALATLPAYTVTLTARRRALSSRCLLWHAVGGTAISSSHAPLSACRRLLSSRQAAFWHGGAPARVDDARWEFVGAEVDQGLLTYMLLARHANSSRYATHRGRYAAQHHWGGVWADEDTTESTGEKPWHAVLSLLKTIDEMAHNHTKLMDSSALVCRRRTLQVYRFADDALRTNLACHEFSQLRARLDALDIQHCPGFGHERVLSPMLRLW